MPICCKLCKRYYRDYYNLTRHLNKKKPCGNFNTNNEKIINDKEIIINHFGKENIVIDLEQFIESWRQINKNDKDEYVCAGKLLTSFHRLLNENVLNHNIDLKNTKSMDTKVLSSNGWSIESTHEIVDRVIKIRSGQLLTIKDQIIDHNQKVFKSEKNKKTWKHLENFQCLGSDHRGIGDQTRKLKCDVKIALITPIINV